MKAVIVIDVEERDIGRKVNYVSVQGGGMSYIVGAMGEDVRLRPLPSKLVPFGYLDVGNEDGLYEKGYNDCIDEITGETE